MIFRSSRPDEAKPAPSPAEHLYVVAYDIADRKRWRRVFRLLRGFGEWVQLSVFQCRLTGARRRELEAALGDIIAADEDHVLIFDLARRTERRWE